MIKGQGARGKEQIRNGETGKGRNGGKTAPILRFSDSPIRFSFLLLFTVHCSLFTATASALTVQEAARELACPCECPLVLEDCNMSCGLDWKDQIGEMIKQGKTKEEIIKYFVDKYGDEAKITPVQRIKGKFYQYTRGFDTKEWAIFGSAITVWVLVIFFVIYLITKRVLKKRADV